MIKTPEFSFGDDSIADAYDNALVPILFESWADRLVEENGPWDGKHVLDLATGTGVVAQRLAGRVGLDGKVYAADINGEMLALASKRCAGLSPPVEFVECPAYPLEITSDSVDFVLCQQGLQFFPDKPAAVGEIFRVLCAGGQVVATTWCPVAECQFFGAICESLIEIGETEIADMMRVPFDLMPESELTELFTSAGFTDVQLNRQEQSLVVGGGVTQAVQIAYSTPIGPKLREMPDERQKQFCQGFKARLNSLSTDGTTMGPMLSNVVSARKPVPVRLT